MANPNPNLLGGERVIMSTLTSGEIIVPLAEHPVLVVGLDSTGVFRPLLVGATGGISATLGAGAEAIGGTKDNGPHWTSVFGVAGIAFTSADATTAAAVTNAPTSGQKLVIDDLIISVGAAMSLTFHEESTAGTVIYLLHFSGAGTVQITPRGKIKLPTADKKLMVDASAAGNVSVTATYHSEA